MLIAPTAQSYVYPHAKCPVCGAEVFFYASENGGRVFFDELGPPWPKHPCTDKMSSSQLAKVELFTNVSEPTKSKSYSWQKMGWTPFEVSQVVLLPPDFTICELTGMYNEELMSLYVKHRGLSPKAPYLLRDGKGIYELSSFQKDIESAGALTKIRKHCYRSVAELVKVEKTGRKKQVARRTITKKIHLEYSRPFGKTKKNRKVSKK